MKVITVLAVGLVVAACSDSTSDPAPATMGTAGSSGSSGTGGDQTTGSGGSSEGGQSGSSNPTTGGGGGSSGGSGGGSAGSGGSGGGASGAGGAGGGSGGGAMSDGGADEGGSNPKGFKCPAGPFPAPKAGASTTVCAGFKYARGYNEGGAWIPGLNAFVFSNFTQGSSGGDISGDIIKYTPGGGCEIFISNVGTNGLALGTNGNIVGACHKTRSITEFDIVTKQPKILADMYNGKMLDSPNDLVVHSNGGIYFSNPTFELGPNRQQGVGLAIFWRNPDGVLSMIMPPGNPPNGVTLSADEKHLYVVGAGQWDLDATGKASNPKGFNFGGADGIATDCAGNIYSSGGSISDADGKNVGNFPGGTNLAFGGADGKTLIVVGGGTSVKTVAMNVPGFP